MQQTSTESKTRQGQVGKVIHWEFCKNLKFDHATKSYWHNPEAVLENEQQKHLWDFDIQTDPLIYARRPHLVKKKELAELWTLLSRLTTE